MDETMKLIQQDWRFIDETIDGNERGALESFALDDTLCASVGAGLAIPTARTWVHHNTVVLGIQDTKVPLLQAGLQFLEAKGYRSIVRNSGGLAVVLDEGVLNLSLILSEKNNKIDINRGYDAMFTFIQLMFSDFEKKIEAREIVGSYCPGSYDLSIDGKKFAGISQRRLRNGVAVQIYLAITNSGYDRAELIQQFYRHAKANEHPKLLFPQIEPSVMASLSELLAVPLTIQDVIARFKMTLKAYGKSIALGKLSEAEQQLFAGYMDRLVERNKQVFQINSK